MGHFKFLFVVSFGGLLDPVGGERQLQSTMDIFLAQSGRLPTPPRKNRPRGARIFNGVS